MFPMLYIPTCTQLMMTNKLHGRYVLLRYIWILQSETSGVVEQCNINELDSFDLYMLRYINESKKNRNRIQNNTMQIQKHFTKMKWEHKMSVSDNTPKHT